VTFSNPAEAELAISCPEAVMGNRFIKVFYHQEARPATAPGTLRERIGTKVGRFFTTPVCPLILFAKIFLIS
jgi:hypothetical protein